MQPPHFVADGVQGGAEGEGWMDLGAGVGDNCASSSLWGYYSPGLSVVICIMGYTDKNIGLQKNKLKLKTGLQKGFGRLLSAKHLEDGT